MLTVFGLFAFPHDIHTVTEEEKPDEMEGASITSFGESRG
jgi:hypothetical protein